MGLHVKQADKKNFSAKHLVDAIKTKFEEQRRQKTTLGKYPKYQFSHEFTDPDVIVDLLRFMLIYAANAPQHNTLERRRIYEFFEKFIPTFFDISEDRVKECSRGIDRLTPEDEDEMTHLEGSNGRGRRGNGKKGDLRRGVLDKGRNGVKGRGHKEGSATGSKESTPDGDSNMEDEGDEATDDMSTPRVTSDRWATRPHPGEPDQDAEYQADQPFHRYDYSLYGNQTIFVFFTIFETLYRRLKSIKDSEEIAKEAGIRINKPKPAKDIGLLPDGDDFYADLNGESYYSRTLTLIEEFITGDVDEANYTTWLRRYYLKTGWQVYTINDLLKSLSRLGAVCSSHDTKEKTPDLIEQFYKNRHSPISTWNAEINMRKQAEKYIKDGELFLVQWASRFIFTLGFTQADVQ